MLKYILQEGVTMNDKIYMELKQNLDQIKKTVDNKIQTKEQLIDIGTQKAYCEIWKLIIKNVKKESFEIKIYVLSTKNGNYICNIQVDNIVKKITRIPVKVSKLAKMLFDDGLSCPLYPDPNKIGIKCYNIPILRVDLENIIESTKNKNKTLK